MLGFIFGIVAAYVIWILAYYTGVLHGKAQAAYEIQEFLDWLEPVDRLLFRQKFREFAEQLKGNKNG